MPPDQPSLKTRLAHALFGDIIQTAVAEATAAVGARTELSRSVSSRVDDAPGWNRLAPAGPQDRDFSEWYQDQEDALEAWRKNFLVRRIVTLARSYVLGGGVTISSDHAYLQSFVAAFAAHPKNRLAERYGPICDELTRAGEIFPVLFTNRVDGLSYLRFVPATQIHHIETDPEDYETELRYAETPSTSTLTSTLEPKWWLGVDHPEAWKARPDGSLPPVMLHFAVNRPIGATRGERADLAHCEPAVRHHPSAGR